jgi:hypothetical protein
MICGWIYLAHYEDNWWALVKLEMTVLGKWNVIFNSSANISFSNIYLLHGDYVDILLSLTSKLTL